MPTSSNKTTAKFHALHQPLEKFPFLSINESLSGDDHDERSRKLFVRSYAKRAALERQRLSSNQTDAAESSQGAAPPAAAPLVKHVTRFRVNVPNSKKKRSLKPKKERSDTRDTAPSPSHRGVGLDFIPPEPSPGRIDPFGMLPAAFGLHQQKLFYFCECICD